MSGAGDFEVSIPAEPAGTNSADVQTGPTQGDAVSAAVPWWRHVTFERVVDTVQTAALIIGISFAVDQSGKLRESIDTSTWSSLASQLTEVDKQFVEHPHLIPYFYNGKVISRSDKDYLMAYAIGVLIIDFMDNSVVMGEHIDPEIFEPPAWEEFYKYQFKQSPIICSIILDEGKIYGAGIVDRASKNCKNSEAAPFPGRSGPRRPPLHSK